MCRLTRVVNNKNMRQSGQLWVAGNNNGASATGRQRRNIYVINYLFLIICIK